MKKRHNCIFSDSLPIEISGGFGAVFANIAEDMFAQDIHLITSAASDKAANFNQYNITCLQMQSQKLNSLPLPCKLPLLLYDVFLATLLSLRKNKKKQLCPHNLVVFVGNDWSALIRGLLCKLLYNPSTTSFYLVDNFIEHSQLSNKFITPLLKKLATCILSQYDNGYFITDNLQMYFKDKLQRMNLPCRTIALPYVFNIETQDRDLGYNHLPEPDNSFVLNFVFTGMITLLTLEALQIVETWLSKHCNHSKLFVVSSNYPQFKNSFNRFPNVEVLHVSAIGNDVVKSIPKNSVFICPHFLPNKLKRNDFFRTVVFQSFPSKLLKMLSLRYPVVLLADRTSSVAMTHSKFTYFLDILDLNNRDPLYVYQKAFICSKHVNYDELSSIHSVSNLFETVSSI